MNRKSEIRSQKSEIPESDFRFQTSDALPAHIAIIMDGNNRWAKERGVTRLRGHTQGAETLRNLLEELEHRPFVRYLTLYAFSTENWQRSPEEVGDLLNLLRHYIKREAQTLNEQGIRLRFIGQLTKMPQDIQRDLAEVEALTCNNTRLTVVMALSYGARQELVDAMQALALQLTEGKLAPEAITEADITRALYAPDIPDPDLLIRTGGDERLSNFLLWQAAYAELYFTETLWPDFDGKALDDAIAAYQVRERRFGRRKVG
jgi:undecaprenyl diphosphate synthase